MAHRDAEILIVEDSPTQAHLLRALLEDHGYRIETAACGKDALEFLSRNKPDLIFTDMVMPGMDGYELTSEIKRSAALKDIPVVLMTSLSDPEEIIRALNAKLDFYLTKPYDEQFLLSKVESILSLPSLEPHNDDQQDLHVSVDGKTHFVTLSPQRSLNLLVSTYENAVQINSKLLRTQLDLRALNHDLENKIHERTAHLQAEIAHREKVEKRVIQRTAELEAVNNELKEFAYAVSHDLKAPLRAVSQLAGWIADDQRDNMDEDGHEMISLLLQRLDRMHSLIEGILQYSRIGRTRESRSDVDLDVLVRDIIDLLAPPLTINVIVERPLPVVQFDRTRIGQVFQNLISNAIKYMDKPEGEVRINYEDEGIQWSFLVSDNGPGIAERHHEKIFGIFQTLSARDEFESTGIGLTLVKKIIDMNGGSIWLESDEGQGTTFFFTIPKVDQPEEEYESEPDCD
ncbi:response regulator [Thermodesulfobacteriota bacterium]